MWIVRLALRRPYTFVVLSLLIFLLGVGTCVEAPKDIYPYINIPVVTIVWSYSGLPPQDNPGQPGRQYQVLLVKCIGHVEGGEVLGVHQVWIGIHLHLPYLAAERQWNRGALYIGQPGPNERQSQIV